MSTNTSDLIGVLFPSGFPNISPKNTGILTDSNTILITDQIDCPALIFQSLIIAQAINSTPTHENLIISFESGFSLFQGCVKKFGAQLSGSMFMDESASCHQTTESSLSILDDLVSRIQLKLTKDCVVILDCISPLVWTNFSAGEVHKFVCNLQNAILEHNGLLVIGMHADDTSLSPNAKTKGDDFLLRSIMPLSSVHMHIRPLPSGRSALLHGELSISGRNIPQRNRMLRFKNDRVEILERGHN